MKRSSLIPEQLSLSSYYFLKRSKIDIPKNMNFLSGCLERITRHDRSALCVLKMALLLQS